jgi:hypothetical protein
VSTRFSDFSYASPTVDYRDESWDEYAPSEADDTRPHDDEESTKKYRLVFNEEFQSVRLESEHIDTTISEAIELSRHILSLEDDWDEEGSPPYEERTWLRATNFVKDLATRYWEATNLWVCPPRIMPGPQGSIDIHWNASNRELLINIPTADESPAGYFGSGGAKDTVKGKLDTSSSNQWILMWLLR